MDSAAVCERLQHALAALATQDRYLLLHDLHERSITHHLALHLASVFPGWDVDCEYNRNHADPKQIQVVMETIADLHLVPDPEATVSVTVYPDIIVHRRGTDSNLLAIEVKKSSSRDRDGVYDRVKLAAFKQYLHYQHAAFVRVGTCPADAGETFSELV